MDLSLRTQAPCRALAALLAVFLAPAALAQSTGPIIPIDLERLRFNPAGTESMLVDTGHVLPEGGYRLMLMAGYERGILVLEGSDGVERPIIDYRVAGWLAGAWSPVDRLELSAKLPVIITQGGNGADELIGVTEPKSFGLGTPELGARFALLRREDGARGLRHRVRPVGHHDPGLARVPAALDDAGAVGLGHVEAVDHEERLDVDVEAAAAALEHLRDVGVLEEQAPRELVVLLVEGAAGDEDADGLAHGGA